MRTHALRRLRRWFNLRRTLALAFLLALASWIGVNAYLGRLSSVPTPFVPELPDTESIQRLLVVAPHCDDEVLAAAGLIREVLARNGRVQVVLITNGDGSFSGTIVEYRKLYPGATDYIRAGSARQRESLNALAALGVPNDDVFFLSYPDRGVMRLWEQFWDSGRPFRSPYTRATKSPYTRTYNPAAVYSGHALLSDLGTIIQDFDPDAVVAPHPADVHPDHWAAGAFTALALAQQERLPKTRLLLYLVHRADYPLPRGYLPFAPLLPPARLVNDTQAWGRVTLADETVEQKATALSRYRSQFPLLGGFLRSFVRHNELFAEPIFQVVPRLATDQALTPDATEWRTSDGSPMEPVAEDSTRDSTSQELGAGADFVALYAAQTDAELWISAELRGHSNPLLSYTCLVRAVNGAEVAISRVLYPPRLGSRPPDEALGRFVLVRFSLAEMGHPRSAVVSFSVNYPGGKTIDRIGWTVINLNQR